MDTNKTQNPNDYRVVEFFNSTDFDFTPALGAMYDSRPFLVKSGEKKQYPYHVGHLLARNLAKAVIMRGAPLKDPVNNPVGVSLYGEEALETLKNSFLTVLFEEEKPVTESETDKLMAKVAELERRFNEKSSGTVTPETAGAFKDKAEVIAELEKRGIAHDKRKNKAELETLLA